MAIDVKEFRSLKNDYMSNHFNEEELEALSSIEEMIDTKISSPHSYANNRISVDVRLVDFTLKPNGNSYNFNELRRDKLFQELQKRYRDGGWTIKRDMDDGMGHSYDYWVLTAKK